MFYHRMKKMNKPFRFLENQLKDINDNLDEINIEALTQGSLIKEIHRF